MHAPRSPKPNQLALSKGGVILEKIMIKKSFCIAALVLPVLAISQPAAADDFFPMATVNDIRGAATDTKLLVELKKKRSTRKMAKDELSNDNLRFTAVRQEALRVGAQAGLSSRYSALTEYMAFNESRMNVTYNFAPFIDGKMLMPAVSKMQDTFTLDESGSQATVVRNSYTISEEARIISNPPTWRDYLWQTYEPPEESHYSILPNSTAEVEAWQEAVEEGWRAGIIMADEIYSDRLAELTKAIEDRYRYQLLLNQKVVQAPVLGVDRRTITYNGRTLNVGETIYTVEQPVNYTASPSWRPIWSR